MRREPDAEVDVWARRVIGAAIEVHRHLGPGYLESVYEEALAIEFGLQGIPFERQKTIAAIYKGRPVGEGRLDFLVMNRQGTKFAKFSSIFLGDLGDLGGSKGSQPPRRQVFSLLLLLATWR